MSKAVSSFVAFAFLFGTASGQEGNAVAQPTLSAVPTAQAPAIDGEVLADSAWTGIPFATGFVQTRPTAGAPASERTEVRVLFDDTTLYIGVICYDTEPDGIIVSDTRRDASLVETDSFQIVLDTFHDRQNGFVFGTNPAGIEYDGQVQDEGRGSFGGGGRQQRGAGGGFNLNWDASWEVAARIGEEGWSAEFAIPFSTLRYPSSDEATWGINFQRNIRRKIETVFWSPLERQFNLYRVSSAGTLQNLEPPDPRLLQVTPYGLVEASRDSLGVSDDNFEFGVDLKYGVTRGLVLDATYNTDFAQVEVDEQQINLDRFSLFFPEKRPFFLENAGLFSVGLPGLAELFFSRRIGLREGQVVPIVAGARLTGKLRDTRVGFLNMQTDAFGTFSAENFTVLRARHEMKNRSHFGGLFVNRLGTGPLAPGNNGNQTFAIDGQKGFGEHQELAGFLAKTETPGLDGDDHALQLRYSSSSEKWLWFLDYAEVAQSFNPEVGFLSRSGFRRPAGLVFYTHRPKDLAGLHEIRPHLSYRGFWNFEGFHETGYLHADTHWEWRNGYEIHTGVNFTLEGLQEPFEIFDGVVVPAGTYEHEEAQIVFNTDLGKPLSFRLRTFVGGFFGGDRLSLTPTVNFRSGERLTSELAWSYNDIDLPGGTFETNLGRLRLTYSFTNNLFLQGLFQYNDTTDDVSTNLRFTWLQTANTGLFVVYNEIREVGSVMALPEPDRSLIVKYTRLFDIFD